MLVFLHFVLNLISLFCSLLKMTRYIEEDDLLRFMKKEEVDNLLPLFEGAVETGKIKRSTFKHWVVRTAFSTYIH